MKYLSDYISKKQTAVFNKYGVFFAFSDKQFNEKKKDGIKYASLGAGMIAPYYEAANLNHALNTVYTEARRLDIAENGIKNIIHRELDNHECIYTGDYSDVIDVLAPYGITQDQIKIEWLIYWQKCIDNDLF